MTLTIEPTPTDEAILNQEALRRGVSVEVLAREVFAEALEDLEDAADAERIIANTTPGQWRSLDDLRKVVRG